MEINPYEILGVKEDASLEEIKYAFRSLVKRYHPDIGGDEEKIVQINSAWEIIKDQKIIKKFNTNSSSNDSIVYKNEDKVYKKRDSELEAKDKQISHWMNRVYKPIDRLIAEVINPLPQKIKELSGDPYDEILMNSFCSYIDKSQKKIEKIHQIYQSINSPRSIKDFSLGLYQCFSEVQDALNEFEIYSAGYVDSYLHDGQEMIRIAKQKRRLLQQEKNNLPLQ